MYVLFQIVLALAAILAVASAGYVAPVVARAYGYSGYASPYAYSAAYPYSAGYAYPYAYSAYNGYFGNAFGYKYATPYAYHY